MLANSLFTTRNNSHPPVAADPAAQAAQVRRWAFLAIGGTALLAVAVVTATIFFMKGKSRDPLSDKALLAELVKDELKKAQGQPQPTAPWAATPVANLPAVGPRNARPLDPDAKVAPQEVLLEVVGGLTGAHLYQTYLNIGLLADSVEKKVYDYQEANNLLFAFNSFVDNFEKQLIQVPPSSFQSEDDRRDMELARTITAQLRLQMRELKAYWATGDNEHAERFHKAREEAWIGIKKVAHVQD